MAGNRPVVEPWCFYKIHKQRLNVLFQQFIHQYRLKSLLVITCFARGELNILAKLSSTQARSCNIKKISLQTRINQRHGFYRKYSSRPLNLVFFFFRFFSASLLVRKHAGFYILEDSKDFFFFWLLLFITKSLNLNKNKQKGLYSKTIEVLVLTSHSCTHTKRKKKKDI